MFNYCCHINKWNRNIHHKNEWWTLWTLLNYYYNTRAFSYSHVYKNLNQESGSFLILLKPYVYYFLKAYHQAKTFIIWAMLFVSTIIILLTLTIITVSCKFCNVISIHIKICFFITYKFWCTLIAIL